MSFVRPAFAGIGVTGRSGGYFRGYCGCLPKNRWHKQRQDYWIAMLTGGPVIQAALTWMVAIPFAVFGGTRKFTWYPSTAPGYPTAASTSAAFPFTVTSRGEFTTARGSEGNGWPGSRPGRVGPRPVANRDKISPAAAGLEVVTSEK